MLTMRLRPGQRLKFLLGGLNQNLVILGLHCFQSGNCGHDLANDDGAFRSSLRSRSRALRLHCGGFVFSWPYFWPFRLIKWLIRRFGFGHVEAEQSGHIARCQNLVRLRP